MTVEEMQNQKVIAKVNAVVKHHGATRDEIIPILSDLNKEIGYLPAEALDRGQAGSCACRRASFFRSPAFYTMLSTKPRGQHVVQFCESAPCHVVGGREVWQTLQDELGLKSGETSPDGKWTLITTSCLGVCGVGPVILVDEDMYGNVKPDQVAGILARYSE